MRRVRLGFAATFGSLALSLSFAAAAQPAEDPFERAWAHIRAFEHGRAVDLLRGFLAGGPSAPDEMRARGLVVEALALGGDESAAAREATALYERDPGFEPEDPQRLAPIHRAIYAAAARTVRAAPPGTMHVELRPGPAGLRMQTRGRGRAIVGSVRYAVQTPAGTWGHWRDASGAGAEREVTLAAGSRVAVRVQALAPSG